MIDAEIVRHQRVNLSYWLVNCKCECKSCYEMRKSIKKLEQFLHQEDEE